jgi:hypothetical protein
VFFDHLHFATSDVGHSWKESLAESNRRIEWPTSDAYISSDRSRGRSDSSACDSRPGVARWITKLLLSHGARLVSSVRFLCSLE